MNYTVYSMSKGLLAWTMISLLAYANSTHAIGRKPSWVFSRPADRYITYSVYSSEPSECHDAPISVMDLTYDAMLELLKKRAIGVSDDNVIIYPCSVAVENRFYTDFVVNESEPVILLSHVNVVGIRTDQKEVGDNPYVFFHGKLDADVYFYFMPPSVQNKLVIKAGARQSDCVVQENKEARWRESLLDYVKSAKLENKNEQLQAFENMLVTYRCMLFERGSEWQVNHMGNNFKYTRFWWIDELRWGGMSTSVADYIYKPILDEVYEFIDGAMNGDKLPVPRIVSIMAKRMSREQVKLLYGKIKDVMEQNPALIKNKNFRLMLIFLVDIDTEEGKEVMRMRDSLINSVSFN
ncbi:hypothetical protein [Pseudaeromonas paramecii]|uniref:Uncharacterized protein n=1 Tax=Pseudaeromonas paramecii TaxID=2138166 RepID=A0ABP8QJB7_9GAMM